MRTRKQDREEGWAQLPVSKTWHYFELDYISRCGRFKRPAGDVTQEIPANHCKGCVKGGAEIRPDAFEQDRPLVPPPKDKAFEADVESYALRLYDRCNPKSGEEIHVSKARCIDRARATLSKRLANEDSNDADTV